LGTFFSCTTSVQNSTDENPVKKSTPEKVIPEEKGTIHKVPEEAKKIRPQEEAKYKTIHEIDLPANYLRVSLPENSFGSFLRKQELKTENNTVYLFNGQKKGFQGSQFAVLKIDVGKRDLQQCADACMRLRGEFLFDQKQYKDIHFNFLGDGKPRYYTEYSKGDRTHKKFRKYMDYIFAYANTGSLLNEMKKKPLEEVAPGDIFIQKGSPYGHAITVMDIAKHPDTGKTIILLSQSYMPAQDIHILKNPENGDISPWFEIEEADKLYTPEWTFEWSDLRKF